MVRAALLCAGVTTLIALPLVHRQGMGANPTSLARNYLRDWLILEAVVALVATLALVILALRARRSR